MNNEVTREDEKAKAKLFIQQKQRISSQELLLGHQEIVIEHLGEEYRLRITSNGKLILTK
jgi:hemin uptake protein HemP